MSDEKALGNLLRNEARQAGVTFAWSEVYLHGIWVEAKWTRGCGRVHGDLYLHIRREVPKVIISKHSDGTETCTDAGTAWRHVRVAPDGSVTGL